ncbi:unnamed protein product, partial [Ectocarpus sp. 4 AP-2014]
SCCARVPPRESGALCDLRLGRERACFARIQTVMSPRSSAKSRRQRKAKGKTGRDTGEVPGEAPPPPANEASCSSIWPWVPKRRAICTVVAVAFVGACADLFSIMQGLGRAVDEGSCIAPCGFDSGDDDAKTDFSATLAEEEGGFPVDESTTTCSTISTEYWRTSRDKQAGQTPVGEVEESTSSPAVKLQIAEPSSRGHQPVEAVMLRRGGRNGTGLCSASFRDILPSTHELIDTTAASWLYAGIL